VGLPDITSPYKSRYENLEKSMNELKMKQRKRRIRGAASASSRRRNFGQKRAVPTAPASPGVRNKPGSPSSSSQNQEMSLPLFDEKQERKRQAHLEHVQELKQELMTVSAKYNAQKLELEHARLQRDEQRLTLEGLTEQGKHLEQQRASMMENLDKLVSAEREVLLKVASQKRYTKVLKNMMWRLQGEMQIQSRTLEAFYRLLELKEVEVNDVEGKAQESFKKKARAEKKLAGAKASIAEEEESFMLRAQELKAIISERQALMEKAKKEKQELQDRKEKMIQERQSAAVVSRMKNDVTTRQLRDLNQHARVHAEAFRKILVATGLTREADVMKRWQNREQYVSEVEQQVKMLHERLEQLIQNNKELTADLRSGKYQPELETAKNRAELADQLETKKSTVRRLRERSTHYAKKMIEVEQTADCCVNSLAFLHRSEKYKQTALEADIQRRRSVASEENSNELCEKLEDLQHRVGFLVETLFSDVEHPRGEDVDEENTSEIDADNPRFFVYWGDSKRVHTGTPSPMSEADSSNVRVLASTKPILDDPVLDDEHIEEVEEDESAPKTRQQLKKRSLIQFKKSQRARLKSDDDVTRQTGRRRRNSLHRRPKQSLFAPSKGSKPEIK